MGPDAMPALPAWMLDMAGSGNVQAKAEQDAQWINNFSDELTVAVALRDWDTAVDLVVKGDLHIPYLVRSSHSILQARDELPLYPPSPPNSHPSPNNSLPTF